MPSATRSSARNASPPQDDLRISAGKYHTCGIKTDGTVACWGSNGDGQSDAACRDVPTDQLRRHPHVRGQDGRYRRCAGATILLAKRHIPVGRSDRSPPGTSTPAESGRTAPLRAGATTVMAEPKPPAGVFQQVSAYEQTCGVKTDGTVACWGYDFEWPGDATRWDVPTGQLRRQPYVRGQDRRHRCVLGSGADFWDLPTGERRLPPHVRTQDGRKHRLLGAASLATPPPGTFQQVSTGRSHACGIKTDGSVACWGSNDYAQADAPPGMF